MFKTLMKKQLMELFSSWFVNRKTGRANPPSKIIRTLLLFVFALGLLAYFFSGLCSQLADGLIADGYDGLYFSVCGILSAFVGIFGSVFNSYAILYSAKDNDLLFSLPIPSGYILASKMTGTFFLSLIYESIVFVPSVIQYNFHKPGFSVTAFVFQIALLFITAFFVTAFTCVFGFVIALAASRVRNKNFAVIIISVAFFAAYYVFYFKLNSYIQMIVANAEQIDGKIKSAFYPFYAMGLGASGDVKYFLIFLVITLVFLAAAVTVMAKTYIKIATSSKGVRKKEYKEEPVKEKSQASALLFKETKHLMGTPVYLLNSGLGILVIPAATVALVIFREKALTLEFQLGDFAAILPALCAAVACLINSMGNYTAPSVSLEGKNLWILKSLPINTKTILFSKLCFHVKMSIIEAELFALALSRIFGLSFMQTDALLLITASYICFTAAVGLIMNLKNVNLEWTNPTVPVKQDTPVILTLLISFISAMIPAVLGAAALFTGIGIGAALFLSLAIYIIMAIAGFRWIMTKGAELFEEL